jgi:hypothetical protein
LLRPRPCRRFPTSSVVASTFRWKILAVVASAFRRKIVPFQSACGCSWS